MKLQPNGLLENTLSKILERVIVDRIANMAKEHALLL